MLGWRFDETDAALNLVFDQAEDSGGGLVTPQMGVALPGGISDSTKTAIRAAASQDIGFPRMVVTEDTAALHIKEMRSRGIPFPAQEGIRFWRQRDFARFAEDLRWKRRRIPSSERP